MSPITYSTEFPAEGLEAVERRERHLRILAELADIGMELVQEVRRQVLEEVVPPGVDPALVFARLAKAVRQTLALEARVAADGFAPVRPVSCNSAGRSGVGQLKAQVRRPEAVASDDEAGEAEGLLSDLHERLDDPEFEDELGDRPIEVIVASICRALGVPVPVGLKDFTDAELEFTPELMDAAAASEAQGDLPGAGDCAGALPVWPPRVGTGMDPP